MRSIALLCLGIFFASFAAANDGLSVAAAVELPPLFFHEIPGHMDEWLLNHVQGAKHYKDGSIAYLLMMPQEQKIGNRTFQIAQMMRTGS